MHKLLKSSVLYTGITTVQKTLSFIMLPLYTRFVEPAELGLFGIFQAACAFFIVLLTFGLDEAALYFISDKQDNPSLRKQRIASIFTFLMLAIILVSIVMITCLVLGIVWGNSFDQLWVYFLALVLVISSPIYQLYQKILRSRGVPIKHALFIASYSLFQSGCLIIFVFVLELQSLGMMLAFALTAFLYFLYASIELVKKYSLKFDYYGFKEILDYSRFIYGNGLLSWGSSNLMIMSLGLLATRDDVGIYTSLSLFSLIFIEIAKIIINVVQPFIYANLAGEGGVLKVSLLFRYIVYLGILLFVAVLYMGDLNYGWIIDDSYQIGLKHLALVVTLGFCNLVILIEDQISSFNKISAKYMSRITLFGLLLNLVAIICSYNSYSLGRALSILVISSLLVVLIKGYFLAKIIFLNFRIFRSLVVSVILLGSLSFTQAWVNTYVESLASISVVMILILLLDSSILKDSRVLFLKHRHSGK